MAEWFKAAVAPVSVMRKFEAVSMFVGSNPTACKNTKEVINQKPFLLIYTDEDLKWDKPPMEVCLLIHLSLTFPLNLY